MIFTSRCACLPVVVLDDGGVVQERVAPDPGHLAAPREPGEQAASQSVMSNPLDVSGLFHDARSDPLVPPIQ